MRILRLTRHAATPEQITELKRIYGQDAHVIEVSETVPNATRVAEIVKENSADVLEAVLPIPILSDVLNLKNGINVPVIRSVMDRQLQDDGITAIFIFKNYEQVLKVEVLTKSL